MPILGRFVGNEVIEGQLESLGVLLGVFKWGLSFHDRRLYIKSSLGESRPQFGGLLFSSLQPNINLSAITEVIARLVRSARTNILRTLDDWIVRWDF